MKRSLLHIVVVVVMVVVVVVVMVIVPSCSRPTMPKPYGYFRIALPASVYTDCATPHACLAINQAAELVYTDSLNKDFFNIHYPTLNATIHCTYLPVKGNLPALLREAQEMVYSHTVKASAIPEREYSDPQHHTYGMLYELKGNTATPAQWYLTDSTRHFFRASVYINDIPNQDSLAPVIDYLVTDSRLLMESIRWR